MAATIRTMTVAVALLLLVASGCGAGPEEGAPDRVEPAAPGTSSGTSGGGEAPEDSTSHRAEEPDPTYWTTKRMREAAPAPMPMEE